MFTQFYCHAICAHIAPIPDFSHSLTVFNLYRHKLNELQLSLKCYANLGTGVIKWEKALMEQA